MTTAAAVAGAGLVPVTDLLFSEGERAALAGFLAGYSGLTRDACTLDLRMYTGGACGTGCTCSPCGGRRRVLRP